MPFITQFNFLIFFIFILIWIAFIIFLRQKKKKSYRYLILFTIFYIYLFKVLDYTLFQFQSLLLLKLFIPNLILNGQTAETSLNLIPLITLTTEDLRTSALNVFLFIPFGFLLPFMTKLNLKKIVMLGAFFSFSIELLQFLTGLIANITFRVTDINDLIFNTLGALIGYLLFIGFKRIYKTPHNYM